LESAAREAGIEPELAAALMFCESSGRAEAVSGAGALGLFQLMPATAREWAARLGLPEPDHEDLLGDAELNARLGTHYLAWLVERSEGDVERALASYNTGPSRVDRWAEEAGGYAAWREQAAGRSDVLAHAQKVLGYRDFYRQRGVFATQPPPAVPVPPAPPIPLAAPPNPPAATTPAPPPDPAQ
jgi:soluble lytic murein transglycosylase